MPTITLASGTDTIVLDGRDPAVSGFTYRNSSLETWYDLPDVTADMNALPNANGDFGWDRLYAAAAKPIISGSFWGFGSTQLAAQARRRITGLYNAGKPITMTVSDELGTFTRQVNVVDASPKWENDGNFEFTISTVAPDPRRYGALISNTIGLPSASSGLIWPLGTSTKGVKYAWIGTPNASSSTETTNGTVTRTNYVQDPSFEGAVNPVAGDSTFSRSTAWSTSGSQSAQVVPTGSSSDTFIQIPFAALTSGTRYRVTADVQLPAAQVGALFGARARGISVFLDGVEYNSTQAPNAAGVTRVAVSFVASANTALVRLYNGSNGTADIVRFDSVLITEDANAQTYFDGNTPASGIGNYWDWGTAGVSGQLAYTNGGNAGTHPSFTIQGGALSGGFRITEIETGRQLTYASSVAASDVVTLDGRNRVVAINGSGNYNQRLSMRQWFTIPPQATRTYQFTPLGGTTGAPTMTLTVATADL